MVDTDDVVIKVRADVLEAQQSLASLRKTFTTTQQAVSKAPTVVPIKGIRSVTEAINASAMKAQNVNKMILDAASKPTKLPAKGKEGLLSIEQAVQDVRKSIKEPIDPPKIKLDSITEARTNLMKTQDELKALKKNFAAGPSGNGYSEIAKTQQKLYEQTNKLNNALGKRQFQGWALSIMFFGMAIKRVFDTIWSSASKTFDDVMHSVYGTVTSFDNLNGAVMYLGFNLGEALAPIAQWLVPIVLGIANWASEHQNLVRILLVSAAVIGTFLMISGMLVLGLAGITSAITIVSGVMTGLRVATLFATTGFTTLWAAILPFIAPVAIIAGIIAICVIIYKMADAMGGVLEFVKSFVRGFGRAFVLLVAVVGGVVAEIVNFFLWMWNQVVSAAQALAQGAVNAIYWLVNQARALIGKDPIQVPKVDLSAVKANAKEAGKAFTDTYANIMGGYLDWEKNSFLAPEKGYSSSLSVVPSYTTTMAQSEDTATKKTSENPTTITNYNNITNNVTTDNSSELIAAYNQAVSNFSTAQPVK